MAIAVEQFQTYQGNFYVSGSFTLTASLMNRMLVICAVNYFGGSANASFSVRFNYTATTQRVYQAQGSSPALQTTIWTVSDADLPASGTYTIDTANTGDNCILFVYELSGVAQQAPEATATNSGTSSPISTNITTISANAFILDALAIRDTAGTLTETGAATTLRSDLTQGNVRGGTSHSFQASPATISYSWSKTDTTAGISHSVAAFEPSAPPVPPGFGVQILNTATGSGTGTASPSLTLTPSTPNRMVLVGIASGSTNNNTESEVTSVTVGGVAATLLGTIVSSTGSHTRSTWYGLLSHLIPGGSSATVSATITASNPVAVIAIEISQAYQELPSITTLAYPSVVTTFTTPIVSPDYYAGAIDLITCYNGGVPAGTKGSSQTTLSAGFNASSSAVGYSSLRSLTNGVYFDMQWSMGYGIVMAHAILLVREARDDALLFGAGF